MTATDEMKVTALAPWFGSNRILAKNVGEALAGRKWVGVPFAGGMAEIAHIAARSIVVTDLHCHVMNLAAVVKDDDLRPKLIRWLERTPFHAGVLDQCQERCKDWEKAPWDGRVVLPWACDYFAAVWMGRSNLAGQVDEFHGGLSARWNANGGDSNTRYRSAVRSLVGWGKIMRRCSFRCMDAFQFIDEIEDTKEHGIYVDPPFFDAGKRYKHNAGKTEAEQVAWHMRLQKSLSRFERTKVVIRYYDHPAVRALFPEIAWNWTHFTGRKQSNAEAQEVLITNNCAG